MKRAPGKAFLIGAGPGDPGLLTLRGLERLARADTVLYDSLVNPEILRFAKPGARLIDVGKRGRSPRVQERIHALLRREAQSGRTVARLKGGDPYLFGRGAEEGGFLRRVRVPFEVVPGITSGMACAAYAGIPLTERSRGSSVAFITGHAARRGTLPAVPWKHLVRAVDTIVVYMGWSTLRSIAGALVRNGLKPSHPAAVVAWGTWPRQRAVSGTLGTIVRKAASRGIGAPAILIVGRVVALRSALDWFGRLPLRGRKVVITRAESQAADLRDALRARGAEVLDLAAIEIRPAPAGPLDRALRNLGRFDWAVFTSPNGVEAVFRRLERLGLDARAFGGLAVAAVGPATAERLRARGVAADFIPGRFTTEALFEELARKRRLAGRRFVLFRSDIAPPGLAVRLLQAGAGVVEIAAYRTAPPAAIRRAWARVAKARPDVLTFTSASTVQNLVRAVGRARLGRLLRRARTVSIGPATTAAMRTARLRIDAEAHPHTMGGLVGAVLRLGRKRAP